MTRFITQAQLAEMVGISKAAVTNAIKKGRVVRDDAAKKIDMAHPTNAAFIRTDRTKRRGGQRIRSAPEKPKKGKVSKPRKPLPPKELPKKSAPKKKPPVNDAFEPPVDTRSGQVLATVNGKPIMDRADAEFNRLSSR